MKKTHLILGALALSAFMLTFMGCPKPNDSGFSDPISLDSEKDTETQDDETKDTQDGKTEDSETERKFLDSEFTHTQNTVDGVASTTKITTKSDGTFVVITTYTDNREPYTTTGTYIIKSDLLKTKVKDSDYYEYWRIKDNSFDWYTLDLSKAQNGWGDAVSIDAKADKLTITNTDSSKWLQVVVPYDEELADGAAYVYGTLNLTSGYDGTQLAITDKPWGAKDNELTYFGETFQYSCGIINLDSEHSYLVISAGWEGNFEVSDIFIGPKNETGTANPPVNNGDNNEDDSENTSSEENNNARFTNPVPEDATAILNPYDFSDFYLPQSFTAPEYAYSAKIVEDETYGKVLSFETSGQANYCSAQITFDEPINLKDKTLYIVTKGKSEIDPSSYSDLKITLSSGAEASETFNFVPTDDTKFVTYSATNTSFWAAYQKEAISDWTKIDSLSFNLQMANYNFQIAAIYCK